MRIWSRHHKSLGISNYRLEMPGEEGSAAGDGPEQAVEDEVFSGIRGRIPVPGAAIALPSLPG